MTLGGLVDLLLQIYSDILSFVIFVFILRYVFFEKALEEEKQKKVYIGFWVIYTVGFIFDFFFPLFLARISTFVFSLGTGMIISIERKEHKIRGFFLSIPISGLISGLLSPFVYLPVNLFSMSATESRIYQFIILTIVAAFFFFFFQNRSKFDRTFGVVGSGTRSLRKWEKTILITIGIFMQFISIMVVEPLESWAVGDSISDIYSYRFALLYSVLCMAIGAFFMSVTAISVIVAGNKQSFYHNKVNEMQFNVILLMADLVDSRDQNTGGHIRRSAKYVEIIARKLKKMGRFPSILTNDYIEDIIVAAPLHDIGKINVSDLILNKPGRFTDDEFEIMKSHAELGREVLMSAKEHVGNYDYINMAIQMAGSHHEWFDGSAKGYPDHLQGEEIPLCARIMAVADVFDALTSKRVYKEAMPLSKAYEIIDAESGTHFDPDVVEAFFAAKSEINEALTKFMEEANGKLPGTKEHVH